MKILLNKCDLCGKTADYLLCQMHMDDMRFPDVHQTAKGEFPEAKQIVLWQKEEEPLYLGGYSMDKSLTRYSPYDYVEYSWAAGSYWFSQGGHIELYDDRYNYYWIEVQSLKQLAELQSKKGK